MKNIILITLTLTISMLLNNCTAQNSDNPKYLGEEYGRFNLAKVTFVEKLDTLLSKVQTVKRLEKDGYRDEETNEYVVTDTIAYVYKINPEKHPNDKIYSYKNLNIEANDLVRFRTTKEGVLGYILFSTDASKKEIDRLVQQIENEYGEEDILYRNMPQDTKLLQFEEGSKKTTITYLKDPDISEQEKNQKEYFVRFYVVNTNIKNSKFLERFDNYTKEFLDKFKE